MSRPFFRAFRLLGLALGLFAVGACKPHSAEPASAIEFPAVPPKSVPAKFSEDEMVRRIQRLDLTQPAITAEIAAVKDPASVTAAIEHLLASMDQWLTMALGLENSDYTGDRVIEVARMLGRHMGANYAQVIKAAEPFVADHRVAEQLEKLKKRHEELTK